MAEILSYDLLKEMKFAEFKKAFKEKTQWKKAKAAIFLIDYKMGTKKLPIAIPLRKTTALKGLIKQIKADKHPNQKLAAGFIKMVKTKDGPQLNFSLTSGGYAAEALEAKVATLFKQLLKFNFIVETTATVTEEEEDTAPNSATSDSATLPKEKNAAPHSPSSDSTNDLKAILSLFNQVKGDLKQEVKGIIKRFKSKNNHLKDAYVLDDVTNNIQRFMNQYAQLPPIAQKKLAAAKQKIEQQDLVLKKLSHQLSQIDIVPQSEEEVDWAITNIEKKIQDLLQKVQ
ncbi:hypothetical protein [Aureispira anguillae]|uniref:Uncharacterized protein n=1 Tax=Aureispira anguillae TaxID=2864201 RepID=A0A915YGZ9_9BACT|nr:hypothetical protein [Aureispira anguillae]BDS12870.1 hypothetical protein AsAng_0035950 [Aureispira anguillae]